MLDHELLRDVINERVELDDEMAAFATAGTGRNIVENKRHSIVIVCV